MLIRCSQLCSGPGDQPADGGRLPWRPSRIQQCLVGPSVGSRSLGHDALETVGFSRSSVMMVRRMLKAFITSGS